MDLNLFKADKEKAIEIARIGKDVKNGDDNNGTFTKDSLADEDANLMIKLKFLTYKVNCKCTQINVHTAIELYLTEICHFLIRDKEP